MSRKSHLISSLVIVTCFVIALLAGGCANDKQVISQADQMHTGLQPAVMNETRLNNYLQSIGDRIIAAAKDYDSQHIGPKSHFSEESGWMFSRNMKFHFVNSEQLNAFTTGGEHMYIYNKLFQTAKSEDELAAVMSHEYAHVYCRHVQKGMNRQMAMAGGAVALGAVSGGGGQNDKSSSSPYLSAGLAAAQFVGMGFTRSDEAQADELGFDFYTRAGWDPRKFGDFFQQMIQLGYDKTPAILSDHPSLASRAEKPVSALPLFRPRLKAGTGPTSPARPNSRTSSESPPRSPEPPLPTSRSPARRRSSRPCPAPAGRRERRMNSRRRRSC